MTDTREIRLFGPDVYLRVPASPSIPSGNGGRRWIASQGRFAKQVYSRGYVWQRGTEVPAEHPAWAWLQANPEA